MIPGNPAVWQHKIIIVTATNRPAACTDEGKIALTGFSSQNQMRISLQVHYEPPSAAKPRPLILPWFLWGSFKDRGGNFFTDVLHN
jgi:hypothetical protein